MRRRATRWLGLLVVAAGAACQGEPSGISRPLLARARVAGEFDARSALLTAAQDPTMRLDVISQDGQFRFNLADGRFSSQLVVPGQLDVQRAGMAEIRGDRLILTDVGSTSSRSIPFTLDAGVLRMTDPTFAVDFNNVGLTLPAVLTAELVRR
jgi:hypothetical protein